MAREFEPSAQAVRNWVAQADQQKDRREAKPTATEAALAAAEREEVMTRLLGTAPSCDPARGEFAEGSGCHALVL